MGNVQLVLANNKEDARKVHTPNRTHTMNGTMKIQDDGAGRANRKRSRNAGQHESSSELFWLTLRQQIINEIHCSMIVRGPDGKAKISFK